MDSLFLRILWLQMLIIFYRFNPCFNGFTILTYEKEFKVLIDMYVSILVLMDSLFLPSGIAVLTTISVKVSILVLMDSLFLL